MRKVDKKKAYSKPEDYDFKKDVKQDTLYNAVLTKRDAGERRKLFRKYRGMSARNIKPGMLMMFNYNKPKTKEQLEFYDAKPVSLFFGRVRTDEGIRVVAFNIHMMPRHARVSFLNDILKEYDDFYKDNWSEIWTRTVKKFKFNRIMKIIDNNSLNYIVRMYIPDLMEGVKFIPPEGWAMASNTEGHFKKKTLQNVIKRWKNR